MQIHVLKNAEKCGQACVALVIAQLLKKPDAILGLPTGSTPIPTYQTLIEAYKQGLVDFSHASSFNLDEYVGLEKTHPCSYYSFMHEQLFDHVNFKSSHLPNGNAANLAEEGANYDAAIAKAGGIDLQILGVGVNGHIGFNEPDSCFTYACHPLALTQSTIDANKGYFSSEAEMPKKAITLGIGGIMNAKQIVLVATGKSKAEAIQAAVHGDITPQWPISILRSHPNVIFLLDEAAAALL